MYSQGNFITGEIGSLAFGGSGILRCADRMVVFVPFTAPKDLIECRLVQVKKNYAVGELSKLISKGPDRIEPRCPYFGTCGGCQLQHLNYSAGCNYKQNAVRDALKHDVDMNPAQETWGYRRHITLTLEPLSRGFRVGYITMDNASLIEVKQCPIFLTEKTPIFETIAAICSELDSSKSKEGKVKIVKTGKGEVCLLFHFDVIPPNFKEVCKTVSLPPSITIGDTTFSIQVEGITFLTQAGLFLQNHEEMSRKIYKEVKRIVEKSKPDVLLDLYCGIGISSIIAAPFAKEVYGVEWDKKAIEFAKKNGADFPHVHFEANDVDKALKRLLNKEPSLVIVNPPRIGLSKEAAEMLRSSRCPALVYISCQPATLERDLKILQKGDFKIEKASAFDMFPQTGHVETLVYLTRF
jgi:23S rRNA (uracil1939-C5)-methyltransferase